MNHAELWLWNPSSKASTKLAESVRSYLWSPDGKYIAYAADNNLIIRNVTDASKTTKIEQTRGYFAWSPDSTQLAYLQDCKVYVINVSGTSTRLIYDINGHGIGGKGGGGGGDEARDYIQEAIDNFPDFNNEIGFLWAKDGTRIALVSPAFGCDLSGVIIQVDGKWLSKCDVLNECHKMLGKSTTDIYLRQQDNLRILLKDDPNVLYRYKYDGVNLSVDAKSPDLVDRRLMTDMVRRAKLTNWGFHNNLWGANSDSSPRRITNTQSFKFQGMISADRAWILFVDIQVKNGGLREGRDFTGDLVSNLWAVRISDGKLVQITTSGDAKLGAWQLALQ